LGMYKAKSIGTCSCLVAIMRLTPIWQLPIFPSVPLYCRCTSVNERRDPEKSAHRQELGRDRVTS